MRRGGTVRRGLWAVNLALVLACGGRPVSPEALAEDAEEVATAAPDEEVASATPVEEVAAPDEEVATASPAEELAALPADWLPTERELRRLAALPDPVGALSEAERERLQQEDWRWDQRRRRTGRTTPPDELSCEDPFTATRMAWCVRNPTGGANPRMVRARPFEGRCVLPPPVVDEGHRVLPLDAEETHLACGMRVCAPCAQPDHSPVPGKPYEPPPRVECPCFQRPFNPWL